MDTSKALEITKAMRTLADCFKEDHQEFLNSLILLHKARIEPLTEAINLENEFRDADIIKRGELLGLNVTKTENGYESIIIL